MYEKKSDELRILFNDCVAARANIQQELAELRNARASADDTLKTEVRRVRDELGRRDLHHQRQVAENNRIAAERMATDSEARGRVEEDRARLRTRSLMGTQIAALAGQGTDLAGSPTDILGDTAAAGETDALTIRTNAAREAWGYRTKGVEFGNEALLAANRRDNSVPNRFSLGASLIGAAGAVAEKWYRF